MSCFFKIQYRFYQLSELLPLTKNITYDARSISFGIIIFAAFIFPVSVMLSTVKSLIVALAI